MAFMGLRAAFTRTLLHNSLSCIRNLCCFLFDWCQTCLVAQCWLCWRAYIRRYEMIHRKGVNKQIKQFDNILWPYTLLLSWSATCSLCWLRTRQGINYNCVVHQLYTFLIVPPISHQKNTNFQSHQPSLVDLQLKPIVPGCPQGIFSFPFLEATDWLRN